MTKKEILEGNRLIGGFMMKEGCLDSPGGHYSCDKRQISSITIDDICDKEDFTMMKYHVSWDWLMPVVEKIERLNSKFGNSVEITRTTCVIKVKGKSFHDCRFRTTGGKIEAVHNTIVKFIKWYNDNDKREDR
jgi:hypothetical protein